jgi:2-phospho-L-lactate transferase/gluconeogenesis factor (CofD/UPF0052 family)
LLVRDIPEAIQASKAFKIFICNLTTQPGETDGLNVQDHLRALENHLGEGLIDLMLLNNDFSAELPAGVEWVRVDPERRVMVPAYVSNFGEGANPWQHDPYKLAERLVALLEERTGPLELPLAVRSEAGREVN